MNRWIANLASVFILFVATANALAVERYHQSALKFVYPLADGNFVLGFVTDSPACLATGNPKYMYIAVGQNFVTAEGAKKMYAAALLAYAAGKSLGLGFDDSTPQCYINRFSIQD